MTSRRDDPVSRRSLVALVLLLGVLPPAVASGDPVIGFQEDWADSASLNGWSGGSVYSNPGHGGVGGEDDGYLVMSTPGLGKLGTFSSDPPYTGNWRAAGVDLVEFWLDDIGTDDPLEIHFSIGNRLNLWQYNQGFMPPSNQWARYAVTLVSASDFTQIIGPGGFEDALRNVELIHIRHDVAPYVQFPDNITGNVGIDRLLLIAVAGVPSGPAPTALPVDLAPPSPNPSRGPVALSLRSFDGGPVTIQIVDVAGRSVRRAELGPGAPGPRLWIWDGLDDRGERVAPGSYRARARGVGGGTSRGLVRVR